MTKEENIATLNEHLDHWKRLLSENICDQDEGEKTIDALQNAIKALEQQSTDAVSRQAVIDTLTKTSGIRGDALKALYDLPPVILQQKMGHWIDIMVGDMPAQACDQCNTFYPLAYTGGGHKYCPNCGAKMQEVKNE